MNADAFSIERVDVFLELEHACDGAARRGGGEHRDDVGHRDAGATTVGEESAFTKGAVRNNV